MRGTLATVVVVCGGLAALGSSWAPGVRAQAVGKTTGPAGSGGGTPTLYAEDGGTRERLRSVVVPPNADAPFTLTLETEWVSVSPDGGTTTRVNSRKIARDSAGRIYQERWWLVPKNGNVESQMTAIEIADPQEHTYLRCSLIDGKHTCAMTGFAPSTNTVYSMAGPRAGQLPNNAGVVLRDELGKQMVAGVEADGTKVTTIYNPGVFGNDRKVTVEREFWYAPSLGMDLLSKRVDSRYGTQTFTATNLILAEPDGKLFEVPEGFKVEDRRADAGAAVQEAN
jgi:hypothetical protein